MSNPPMLQQDISDRSTGQHMLALHGLVGVGLLAAAWPLNWLLDGPRTYWLYFPLWWGLTLTADALCLLFTGSSLLSRSPRRFLYLGLLSIPGWWIFEGLNLYSRSWHFEGGHLFNDLPLGGLATLALSAVMPFVLSVGEMIASSRPLQRLRHGPVLAVNNRVLNGIFACGILLITLVLVLPHYCYPLIWSGILGVLEPVNFRRNSPSLLRQISQGDWRVLVSMMLAGLAFGIFSEMWNFYSSPKWVYDMPYFDFWHVFELPLLGYAIFLSVGPELYAFGHFVLGLFGEANPDLVQRKE